MTSPTTHAVLLDAAMLRHSAKWAELSVRPDAIPLYADLGESATSVGPWLFPGLRLVDVQPTPWPLPERLGCSEIEYIGSIDDLQRHLLNMRVAQLEGGQTYYLRYADMRALEALVCALATPSQRALLAGPITSWRYIGRGGEETAVGQRGRWPAPSPIAARRLSLSNRQLGQLLDASLADRLAAAVDELAEPGATPQTQPGQFEQVVQAARFALEQPIDAFVIQRALAHKAAVQESGFLSDPAFLDALPMLSGSTDPHGAILRWQAAGGSRGWAKVP